MCLLLILLIIIKNFIDFFSQILFNNIINLQVYV